MTHELFITMGGLHLFVRGSKAARNDGRCISQEDDKPHHLLEASYLLRYSESFSMPTEAEIKDREQRLARQIPHLPPNIVIRDAMHRTYHWIFFSYTFRNCHPRICGHESGDIHLLVE